MASEVPEARQSAMQLKPFSVFPRHRKGSVSTIRAKQKTWAGSMFEKRMKLEVVERIVLQGHVWEAFLPEEPLDNVRRGGLVEGSHLTEQWRLTVRAPYPGGVP